MYSEKETISSESLIDSLHYQGTGRDICSSHLICRLAYSHYLIFTYDLTFYLVVYCRSSYPLFISLSNRKNLRDWESHLRVTWISRLEDIACAWSPSLSFDHRSGQDSHGDFFPDTTICHRCTQVHGIKSWIPVNQFRIIVLGTRHQVNNGEDGGKQDNWLDYIWFPPGARAGLWMVERLALMPQWFVFHDIN